MAKPKYHVLYVYGTLRTGRGELVAVPGRLYNLGWYPGCKLQSPEANEFFTAERLEDVSEQALRSYDAYEGYNPDDEANSLYIRRPYLDGWIYEYNHSISEDRRIPSGNWFDEVKELS